MSQASVILGEGISIEDMPTSYLAVVEPFSLIGNYYGMAQFNV